MDGTQEWRPLSSLSLSRESSSTLVEALWKRQTAAERSSQARFIARRAVWATDGGRPQQLLAPYKQEVARSSRAPPILTRQQF
jgi:hypothetical protein